MTKNVVLVPGHCIVCLSRVVSDVPGAHVLLQGMQASSKRINYLSHVSVGVRSLLLVTQNNVKNCHN